MAARSTMTIRGWVATNPVCRQTASGRHVTSFRIADSVRRRDAESGVWSDTKTTWYTAQVWGEQALNVAESLRRSDAVIVTGHPWLEEWRRDDGELATRLVIDADAVGPDLAFGTSRYARTVHASPRADADGAAAASAPGEAVADTDPDTDPDTETDDRAETGEAPADEDLAAADGVADPFAAVPRCSSTEDTDEDALVGAGARATA